MGLAYQVAPNNGPFFAHFSSMVLLFTIESHEFPVVQTAFRTETASKAYYYGSRIGMLPTVTCLTS